MGKHKQRVKELEQLCTELYQVIGILSDRGKCFTHQATQHALDNVLAGSDGTDIPHDTLLPFVVEKDYQESYLELVQVDVLRATDMEDKCAVILKDKLPPYVTTDWYVSHSAPLFLAESLVGITNYDLVPMNKYLRIVAIDETRQFIMLSYLAKDVVSDTISATNSCGKITSRRRLFLLPPLEKES